MDPRFEKVDALFAGFDKTTSPGCSLAIFQHGEIIYARGYGMANLEHAIANQPWTRFYLASMSKQFTAMCIALLVEEGKLALDDDLRKFIPEIPAYQAPITVRHLVHHTSGLRDYLTLGFMAGGEDDAVIVPAEALELLARQKELNFNPGDEYLYSNSGYILLAMIVEKVSGKTFRAYIHENIFKPLGMKHTHAHDNHLEPVPARATAYTPGPQGYRIAMPNFDMVGDGGIYSSVEDLFLWDLNFYHNRLGKARPELLEMVQTTGKLNNCEAITYAFGLSVESYKGLREVRHAGGYGGYATEMIRYPDQNFSVVILGNSGSVRSTDLARQVAEIFLAENFQQEAARQAEEKTGEKAFVILNAEELKLREGSYYSPLTGMLIELAVKEGRLCAALGEYTLPLAALDAHTFLTVEAPFEARIVFEEEAAGKTLAKLSMGSGKPITFEKIVVVAPSADELAAICGGYFSEELQAKCEIYLYEGQPMLKIRQRREALKAGERDHFYMVQGALVIARDDNEEVIGLFIHAGRVRNIHYHRLV